MQTAGSVGMRVEEDTWQSKRALTAVMFFFTLAETGDPGKLPLITSPAQ